MLVDIHAHLNLKQFERDLSQVIERARKAKVAFIVSNGGSQKENEHTLALSSRYAMIKAAIGIDPNETEKMTEEEIQDSIDFIKKNKENIVSIGEVGLEGKYPNMNIKKQEEVFQRMIELSEKTRLPLNIHSRQTEHRVFEMVQSSDVKNAIFHCFCGRLELAKKIVDDGHFVSITTNIVNDLESQKLAKELPLTNLLTETDSPFLSPFKGKRNEPAFVIEALKKIAELKGIKIEEAEEQIFENSKTVLGI